MADRDPDDCDVQPDDSETCEIPAFTESLPERIGHYRIETLIGTSPAGQVVYLAFDEQLDRKVTIKAPSPGRIPPPEEAERLLSDASRLATISHPQIVTVSDFGSTEEVSYFMVSRYIESDLRRRLNESWPSHADAAKLMAKVAEILHFIHKQGIVHRDVKPGNILLDKNGQPYLTDFRLAVCDQ